MNKKLTKEEFLEKLKTDNEFNKKYGKKDITEGKQVLPPCHYGFQIYTRKLTDRERIEYMGGKIQEKYPALIEQQIKHCDEHNTPTRAISLMWNQRSVDTFLGLPFNIASYGLLLEIIAKEVNMVPDELIGNLGDTHLYSNHIEQAKEQIGREPYLLPKLILHDWYSTQGSGLNSSEEISYFLKSIYLHNIEIKDYKSHPTIKASLSN